MSNIKLLDWMLNFFVLGLFILTGSTILGVTVLIFFIIDFVDLFRSPYYLVTYSFEEDGRMGKGCKCVKGELDINSFISKTKVYNGFDEVIITYAKHITKQEYENFNK